MIDSAAGFICENASALTAARLTWASGSLVDAVNAGIDSSSFRKPMTPIACTRTAASLSLKSLQRRLERVLAPQFLQRAERAHADERMPVLDQGKYRIGACRVLEFGHAVSRSRATACSGSTSSFARAAAEFRTIEFPERHRHLLTHSGVGIGDHAAQMPNGRRIPGMTKRDDRHPTLARIGGLRGARRRLRDRRRIRKDPT